MSPLSIHQWVSARAAAPPALYATVVFAGAWLVFWIQPLAVRGLLPALGGSAMVWNTAMVFFQGTLLGGYALAHLAGAPRMRRPRRSLSSRCYGRALR